jgi:uncharacterized hydrophobic protein (TIGR00271 family)
MPSKQVETTIRPRSITLSRDLSLFDVTLIGVGAMIGAGIFVLSGIAAGLAGPGVLLAFFLNGMVTTITAASYAELGSCFPEAGGGYLWVREGLGRPAGFLSGWMSWFAHAVACSVYALGFGAYLAELIADLGWINASPQVLQKPFGVGVALLFAYVNYRGAKETGRVGNLVTLAKIAILGMFVVFGLAALGARPGWPSHFVPFLPNGMNGVIAAMGLTFIAFEGYEIIAQSGEEVRRPKRNIPRAIFLSIAIAVVIYLFVAFVALAAVNGEGQPTWQYLGAAGETAMIQAARQFLPGGAFLLIIAGLLSTTSALNATIYSSSRVSFAMGRDKTLPDVLGAIHPHRRTPHWAISASAVLIVGMAVALPIQVVASAAGIMFLLLFMLVNVSAITLRHKWPDLDRGFRVPLVPALPIIGIVSMAGTAAYLFVSSPQAGVSAAIWIGVGAATYYLYATRRELAPRAPIVEAHVELTRDFRVLLPVVKPERAEQLAPLAAALAGANEGEVLAIQVEVVPQQLPLRNGWHFGEAAWPVVGRAEQIVAGAGVPAHSMVRIGHDAVSGIVEAAREINADVVIMGWQPQPRTRERLLGPTLDPLLANPPSDVLVMRAEEIGRPRQILVPVAGGPNATLALKYALSLAESWDGQVTAMMVASQRATEPERVAAEKLLRETVGRQANHPRLKMQVVAASSPIAGILNEAANHDLVMLGASREGIIDRALFGDIPEQVAARSNAPVIIVKRRLGPVTGGLRRTLDGVSALLPRLSPEDRVEVYKAIRRSARPDADYFVMIGLAAAIAAMGLLLNSPAVIIGAMLVAPLMAAIVGLGMGVMMGDLRLLRLATGATIRGMLLAIAIGVVVGWLPFGSTLTAEILSRTSPTLLDLGVALFSGAAGAYALCRKDVSAALPGVAIAAALVPPLATVGIGLSHSNLTVAGGAMLLFLSNLIAISAASVVIFLLFGFRPAPEAERRTIFRRGAISATVLLIIVAGILGVLTFNLVSQARFEQQVRAAVATQVAQLDEAQLVDVTFTLVPQGGVHLDVTIRSPYSISYEQTVALQKGIAARLDRTVSLLLTVVPVTELNPLSPPTRTPTLTSTPTPTPMPTLTPRPTTTPTSTASPSPSLTPTATSSSTPTTTPTATVTATPVVGMIANTGGRGVFVHASPGGPAFTAWSEGTRVVIVSGPETANGQNWLRVRNEIGIEGWVAAGYVSSGP